MAERVGLRGFTATLALLLALPACGGGGGPAQQDTRPATPQAATPQAAGTTRPASEEPAGSSTPAAAQSGQVASAPAGQTLPPQRETETSPYGYYTIQFSSWRSRGKAEAEVRRLQGGGLEAYLLESRLGTDGTWFRVRVGRYPALSEAQRAAHALQTPGSVEVWVDNYVKPGAEPR